MGGFPRCDNAAEGAIYFFSFLRRWSRPSSIFREVRTPAMRHARAVLLEDFLRWLPSPSARLAGLPSAQIVVQRRAAQSVGPAAAHFAPSLQTSVGRTAREGA